MAKQTTTYLVDDFDGSQGEDIAELVFGWRSSIYSIDLNETNTKAFTEAITPFLSKAQKLGQLKLSHLPPTRRSPAPTARATATVDREQNQAIRDWARAQGYKVSDRGRIPQGVVDEFHRTH